MKTRIFPLLAICGAIANPGLLARAVGTAPSNATPGVPATAAPEFSGRINDVVSLTKSGVEESVVLSFIKASPGPFQPSADEIIKLRDEGIPSQVITAMLQRGAELRDQAAAETAQVTAAAQAPVITAGDTGATDNTVATAAIPTETPPATYAGAYATQPASSVVYVGGDYGNPYYTYPYYSGYISTAFFYPFPCWFGGCFYPHGCYFPHGGFVHDGFHLHDGFHGGFVARGGFGGGFHGGFVGRGGFGGGFRGGTVGGFHGGTVGGFRGGTVGGFRGGFTGGFHGPVVGGFHGGVASGGFHGSVGGGFHGGGFSGGGFHAGGGFHGGGFGGGGFHGGGFGGGGFHGGGGGGHR